MGLLYYQVSFPVEGRKPLLQRVTPQAMEWPWSGAVSGYDSMKNVLFSLVVQPFSILILLKYARTLLLGDITSLVFASLALFHASDLCSRSAPQG